LHNKITTTEKELSNKMFTELPPYFTVAQDGKIGQGAFGSVYRVCDKRASVPENCNLVMKVFPKWYQDEHDECLATAVASLKSFGPRFHGCWRLPRRWKSKLVLPDSDAEYMAMILDLHGISLLQYLAAETSQTKREKALQSLQELKTRMLESGFSHDINNENYVVKEYHDKKFAPQVAAIDWRKEDLPSLSPLYQLESKLQVKLARTKQLHDFLYNLQRDVSAIKSQPAKLRTAQSRLKWLLEWEKAHPPQAHSFSI
jgi:hypothetical protein